MSLITTAFPTVVAGYLAVHVFLLSTRPKQLLESWAKENGYTLINKERREFFRGPFFWNGNKLEAVFFVTVADAAGETRSGWIRFGRGYLGLLSDRVQVQWKS